MKFFNSMKIHDREKVSSVITARSPGQGLLTVMNHLSALDDPLLVAPLFGFSVLCQQSKIRWTFAAYDQVFSTRAKATFFKYGKVLPMKRGAGLHQAAMDVAVQKLNEGEWVHFFPEGTRTRDPREIIRHLKIGVGRLVADPTITPIVIPIVHTGLEKAMPVGRKLPKGFQKIMVTVGDPINFDDLLKNPLRREKTENELYADITDRIHQTLWELLGKQQISAK